MTPTLSPPPDVRVTQLWRSLVDHPDALTRPGVTVVSSDGVGVTRPGFCGVVVIGDAAIVTMPTACPLDPDRLLRSVATPVGLTDPASVSEAVGPLDATLGPADLQYGEVWSRRSNARGPFVLDDDIVQQALAAMPEDDRDEAGFGNPTVTSIFVATDDGEPAAVAGYQEWAGIAAHIGVATVPNSRRRGLGRAAAEAAAAHATARGLLVQWRSLWSNDASRALGASLGLVRCGRQFSFRVADI